MSTHRSKIDRPAASSMTDDLLFVYGTLLTSCCSEAGRLQRYRLSEEARSLGGATIHGRLFRMGPYPVLDVHQSDEMLGHRVFGEAFALASSQRTLAWLDRYEGIGDGAGLSGPYRRQQRQIELAGGRRRNAWVYLSAGPLHGVRPIAGGRWTDIVR
jgi:gamma-glutamylcyclotransferase (GGCT)/AIG2-like uncharacterized protein YtfP